MNTMKNTLPSRRDLLGLAGSAVAAAALPGLAWASDGKPVRLLVGFPAGGGTDAIARLLAERLKDLLGAPVIVENRPGAGGQLAAQALKAAPADGTTLFLSHDHTISILPLVVRNPGYEPARDFVPVAGFATFVNALALSGGTPARSVAEYVAWVRAQGQGKGAIGVPAPASVPEFLVQVIGRTYGLDLVAAPYRGSAPMMNDMLGHQIAAGVGSIPDFIESHKAGRIRVVAVLGGARQAALPDVPTFAELGLAGFEDVPYYGVFAPAGTPRAAIDGFSAALGKVLAQPDVRERLTAMGLSVGLMSAAQLGEREAAYARVWSRIIAASGFKPQ
ncbi:Bug family tripartite tricarboxylate transporter substrate binding protein [Leptothrix discophora]|uniref:Bug family tripartite tricarboxylate transporter substrate binding protein n=1 Tax=Leptothrix discophora TaxID=89 RepID=A0ABT9G7V1_LEPDI|nr:Bug family tripartite tricarboxylate transporter substrate binding protein [Leptothrix discophora]MDP4302577.1 Bug family tripartite tricarboxylate transporter substrate binding protein [Leptothrix discophora]